MQPPTAFTTPTNSAPTTLTSNAADSCMPASANPPSPKPSAMRATRSSTRQAFYGKSGPAISLEEYTQRFHQEMQGASYWINSFAQRVQEGATITLLCSSACVDASRCHRSLVKALIEEAARKLAVPAVPRRVEKQKR